MISTVEVIAVVLALSLGKWLVQLGLEWLNRRNVMAHSNAVPEPFKGIMNEATYARSVAYTLAKGRLHLAEITSDLVILLTVLFSGVLPVAFGAFVREYGSSPWAQAAFLFMTGCGLSLLSLPLSWYAQFHLEERFGFNRTTPTLWWLDRLKGLLLATVLGYPLLVLVLKLIRWTGLLWWLWAWAALVAFQLLMAVLAPVLILPMFNKFTPLPEGSLRDRLLNLANKTRFRAKSIQVMDGSKRSRHSNAFFTGFGALRKIVLFDTLIEQLAEPELEAVLAHEIGHYKKKHIPKMLLASALGSLAGFYLVAVLAQQSRLYRAFGFEPGSIVPALLLLGLLGDVVAFWLSPLVHLWSRRHEYQADAFAAQVMAEPVSLISALRKLNEKNLSNLTPHPLYSGFYYSHPTLVERERALRGCSGGRRPRERL